MDNVMKSVSESASYWGCEEFEVSLQANRRASEQVNKQASKQTSLNKTENKQASE